MVSLIVSISGEMPGLWRRKVTGLLCTACNLFQHLARCQALGYHNHVTNRNLLFHSLNLRRHARPLAPTRVAMYSAMLSPVSISGEMPGLWRPQAPPRPESGRHGFNLRRDARP